MEMQNKKIIGRLEYVSFPDFGIENVEAKVDTGAYSGSIHVSSVKEAVDDSGVPVLEFFLLDEDHPQYNSQKIVVSDFFSKYVRNSNGSQKRYFIKTKLKISDQVFETIFSLTNRTSLRRAVLLGRKNIRHKFIVDVGQKFLLNSVD